VLPQKTCAVHLTACCCLCPRFPPAAAAAACLHRRRQVLDEECVMMYSHVHMQLPHSNQYCYCKVTRKQIRGVCTAAWKTEESICIWKRKEKTKKPEDLEGDETQQLSSKKKHSRKGGGKKKETSLTKCITIHHHHHQQQK